MDKNLTQQNHPESLNRSLLLHIYRHLAHVMLQQCEDIWRKMEQALKLCVLKDFLLWPPHWGTDLRGEELTCSGCPFAGIQSMSPVMEGCARCLAVLSPTPKRCSSLMPKGHFLPSNVFHIWNFVVFLITFQLIETHKYIFVAPRVCA